MSFVLRTRSQREEDHESHGLEGTKRICPILEGDFAVEGELMDPFCLFLYRPRKK